MNLLVYSLGFDSPFFLTIVLFKTKRFPWVSCGLSERRLLVRFPSGWPKRSPACFFNYHKMAFPKSLKSRNSGSEFGFPLLSLLLFAFVLFHALFPY